jgi:hypothetical protein
LIASAPVRSAGVLRVSLFLASLAFDVLLGLFDAVEPAESPVVSLAGSRVMPRRSSSASLFLPSGR